METDQESNKKKCCRQCKYTRQLFSVLGFFGVLNMYAMRVNMNVALVAMVKESAADEQSQDDCSEVSEPSYLDGKFSILPKPQGDYDWSPSKQSHVLSSFFFGYLVTTFLGGLIATKYGAKWVFGVGILLSGIFELLTPVLAGLDIGPVYAARAIQGLAQGVAFPAINSLVGQWIPRNERSMHFTIIYSGIPVGTILGLGTTGVLADSKLGWTSVFYLSGASACLWFIFWALLSHEDPYDHPYITEAELVIIREGINRRPVKRYIPWKPIAKSVPFYALVFANFGDSWGFFTLFTGIPFYMGKVLSYDIQKNGFLATGPYVGFLFCAVVASFIADVLRTKDKLKITTTRKIMSSIALFIPGICLLAVPFLGCRPIPIVALLTVSLGLNGLKLSGNSIAHIDMSPDFAGFLNGISNTFAAVAGILAPCVIQWSTGNEHTRKNWQIVFFIAAALYLAAGLVFVVFGSAEEQPWGIDTKLMEEESSDDKKDEDEESEESR